MVIVWCLFVCILVIVLSAFLTMLYFNFAIWVFCGLVWLLFLLCYCCWLLGVFDCLVDLSVLQVACFIVLIVLHDSFIFLIFWYLMFCLLCCYVSERFVVLTWCLVYLVLCFCLVGDSGLFTSLLLHLWLFIVGWCCLLHTCCFDAWGWMLLVCGLYFTVWVVLFICCFYFGFVLVVVIVWIGVCYYFLLFDCVDFGLLLFLALSCLRVFI